MIKIFPAARLGPGYLRDLLGPFPQLRPIPTGGIDFSNAAYFMTAGALALGIGSALTDGTGRARRAPELSQEQGKPLHEANDEINFAAQLFRDAADYISKLETSLLPSAAGKRIFTLRQPHGVVAVLTPWNYPVGIPSEYLSAALAAGNVVVWKPAPTTSMIAARLVECLLEAGLPGGAIKFIQRGAGPGEEIVGNS